jgi:hypothetical protein
MKISKFCIIIALFLGYSVSIQTVNAEKRALIVAIGKYPAQSGWPSISSDNDVQLIKSALKIQGFNTQNIAVVTNEQATKAGIVSAFNALINNSQAGDIVVFHFSGHGQQVTDTNGDELDGLDEALVPYDAGKTNLKGSGDLNNHLIDDELSILLGKLRTKVGGKGDVLVFLDACHTGTGTRGMEEPEPDAIYRGTNEIYVIPGYEKVNENKKQHADSTSYEEELPATRGAATILSPILIMSACSAEQQNKEYRNEKGIGFGSLSYALSKVLTRNTTGMSYMAFFESVRNEMLPLMGRKHYQTPQIEGNPNRTFFAGKTVNIPEYFSVNKALADGRVVINAGTLTGIFPGAEIAFYPADTYNRNKTKPLVTCKVDSAALFESTLSLGPTINKKQILNSWAFVTKYRYYTSTGENPDEMRARVLRNAKSSSKNVVFQLIPVDKLGKSVDLRTKIKNGNVEFRYGDRFVIRVTNNDKIPMFFQLVDVMPNNSIALATDGTKKYDYILQAGESKIFPKDVFKVESGSPLGMETLVLIASEKQLDLSAIENQKPQPKRSDSNEFEEWLNEVYSSERSISIFDSNKVNIATKSFIVKEK